MGVNTRHWPKAPTILSKSYSVVSGGLLGSGNGNRPWRGQDSPLTIVVLEFKSQFKYNRDNNPCSYSVNGIL
jgi:hypothetical protein